MSTEDPHEQPVEHAVQAEPAAQVEPVEQVSPAAEVEPVEQVSPAAASADPRVVAALRRADELAATSPADHVDIYEDVHRTLQEVLADASGQTPVPDRVGHSSDAGDTAR